MSKTISFYCVGAQKCGTTALHHYLNRHPDIALPSVKETHFFDNGHGEWGMGIRAYCEKYFGHSTDRQILGEIDPEYLFFPEAPARIAAAFPLAKLIFIFREPVSRAYSHYWMTVRRGREPLPFAEAIAAEPSRLADGSHLEQSDFSYLSRGLYFAQVCRYLAHFPREQMLFLLSDDLRKAPERTLQHVYEFIGIPARPYEPISDDEAHQAYMPISMTFQGLLDTGSRVKAIGKTLLPAVIRRPAMQWMWQLQKYNRRQFKPPSLDEALRAKLTEHFNEDRAGLAATIGRDLGAWSAPAMVTEGS